MKHWPKEFKDQYSFGRKDFTEDFSLWVGGLGGSHGKCNKQAWAREWDYVDNK